MGILTTAAAAAEGKAFLVGLDTSRSAVLDVADGQRIERARPADADFGVRGVL